MLSDDSKFHQKVNSKLLFDEIAKKAKCKKEKDINRDTHKETLKIPKTPRTPKTPMSNRILTSPYISSSPKIRSPTVPRTPNRTATSPYYKCLQSPKTPKTSFVLRSPYSSQPLYSPKRDPWVYISTENERSSKLIGIDEYGNIAKIPTVDYPLPQTVRYIIEDSDSTDDSINLYDYDIYLDQKNSKGRDYNFVAQNMKNISIQTNNLRSLYANKFKSYDKNIKGRVSLEIYEELLEIYENNQVYYQDCMQNESMTYDHLCEALTELEYWFICIIEPYDHNDPDLDKDDYNEWKSREQFKINKGFSGYCDPDLYFYIKQPLPQEIIRFINSSHKNLF